MEIDAQQCFYRALADHQVGNIEAAQSGYEKVLQLQPQHCDAHHLLGMVMNGRGEHAHALQHIEHAIRLKPEVSEFWGNRALALDGLRRHTEALESFSHALRLRPDCIITLHNRANTMKNIGKLEDASHDYERILALAPDNIEAWLGLIVTQQSLHRHQDAIVSCVHALKHHPQHSALHWHHANSLVMCQQPQVAVTALQQFITLNPTAIEAYFNLAMLFKQLKQPQAAVDCYNKVLTLNADFVSAYFYRALIYHDLKQLDLAIADYQQTLKRQPDHADAYCNLGNALRDSGRMEEALTTYRQAIACRHDFAEVYSNVGNILKALGEVDEAIRHYEICLALKPELAAVQVNKAIAMLIKGDFAQGWVSHEWRWQWEGYSNTPLRQLPQPLWLGKQSLVGKTILLHSEQALGDSLQFCRYAKLVHAMGARVLLEVERPLLGILNALAGVDCVLEKGQALPDFDYHCPLLSLPLACGTHSPDVVPADVPYLFASPSKIQVWHEKLGTQTKPRVGLVWSGNLKQTQSKLWNVNKRNIPFTLLATLNRADIDFYSLQKGEPAESELITTHARHWQGDNFHVLTQYIHDFTDTAALIYHLDLVIAVDTSTAHLAGAMGKPVWLLNRFDSCWRWLLGRDDSPWYPTMHIFKQQQPDDWASVLFRVSEALDHWRRNYDARY